MPDRPAPLQHIGLAIKILRTQANLNQAQLADRSGITKAQASKYERGHQRPTLDSLDKIMVALGIDMIDLSAALTEADRAVAFGGDGDGSESAPGDRLRADRRRTRREVALLIERYLEQLEEAVEVDGPG